jgi:TonB family protein
MWNRGAKQSVSAFAIQLVLLLAIPSLCHAQESRRVLRSPTPVYPALAKRRNLSGTVKIKAVVTPDGQLRQVEVIGGDPVLTQAALEAVKEWRYAPGKTETHVELEFRFRPE